ncbi:MAG: D-glycerate dehydrogenase [Candidatus Tenebribacter burtonii]|jgi:glyoxylate reductase|nr:D-glycerate dehydrogenase [Candidatus Tenebribacter burtonii]
MKPKIFVTRMLPDLVMEKLNNHFIVNVNTKDIALSKTEIIHGTSNCDILLCLLSDTIDSDIISCNPNLKGIVNYAVGFNNIDVKYATKLNIPITNTPGVLTETTADMAWALMFSVARRIVESDKFVREEKFKGWAPKLFLGADIYGKTLGIIGAGRIGTAVAKRALGFNMKVLYSDDSSNIENTIKAEKVDLEKLLKESDFVSLHVPILPETKYLIGEKELQMMKSTAILINTSRGAVVNEEILLNALQKNWIAGAGLDVYENEPKLIEGLIDCDNVVLAAHIASASVETRTNMGFIAINNALAIWQGKIPPQIVNKEIYEK